MGNRGSVAAGIAGGIIGLGLLAIGNKRLVINRTHVQWVHTIEAMVWQARADALLEQLNYLYSHYEFPEIEDNNDDDPS